MSLFHQARIAQQPPYYSWISPLLQESISAFRRLLTEDEENDQRFWIDYSIASSINPQTDSEIHQSEIHPIEQETIASSAFTLVENGQPIKETPPLAYDYHLSIIGSALNWMGVKTPSLVIKHALNYYRSIEKESFSHSNLQLAYELFLYLQHTIDLIDKNIHPNGFFSLSLLHQFQKLDPTHEGDLSSSFDVFDPPFYKKPHHFTLSSLIKEDTPKPSPFNQDLQLLEHHEFFIPTLYRHTHDDPTWQNHWRFYSDLPLEKSLKLSLWRLYQNPKNEQALEHIKKFYLLEDGNDSWAQNVGMSKEDLASLCQEIRQHFLNLKDTIDVWALHGIQDEPSKEAFLIQWRQFEQTCQLLNLNELSAQLRIVHDELQRQPDLSYSAWEQVAMFLTELDLTLEEKLTDGEKTSITPQQKEAKKTLFSLHECLLEQLQQLKNRIEKPLGEGETLVFPELDLLESGLLLIEHPLKNKLTQSFSILRQPNHVLIEVIEAFCWIEAAIESLTQHAPHLQDWLSNPLKNFLTLSTSIEQKTTPQGTTPQTFMDDPRTQITPEPPITNHEPFKLSQRSPEMPLTPPSAPVFVDLSVLQNEPLKYPFSMDSNLFLESSTVHDPKDLELNPIESKGTPLSKVPTWVTQELNIDIEPHALDFNRIHPPLLIDPSLNEPDLNEPNVEIIPPTLEPSAFFNSNLPLPDASSLDAQPETHAAPLIEWIKPDDAPDIRTIIHTEDLIPTYPKPEFNLPDATQDEHLFCDASASAKIATKTLLSLKTEEFSALPAMDLSPAEEPSSILNTTSEKEANSILGNAEQDSIILASFQEELQEFCELRQSIDLHDWTSIQRCFHTLKGNAMALRHKSGSSLGLMVEKHIKTFMHLGHDQFNIKEQGLWLHQAFDHLEYIRDHYLETQDEDHWLESFFARKPTIELAQSKLEHFMIETRTAEARLVQNILQNMSEEQRFSLSYYCQQYYPAGLNTQWNEDNFLGLQELHSFAKFLHIAPIIDLCEGGMERKKISLLLVALVDILLMDEIQELKVLLKALHINTQALCDLSKQEGQKVVITNLKHFKHLTLEQIEILQRLQHLSQHTPPATPSQQ